MLGAITSRDLCTQKTGWKHQKTVITILSTVNKATNMECRRSWTVRRIFKYPQIHHFHQQMHLNESKVNCHQLDCRKVSRRYQTYKPLFLSGLSAWVNNNHLTLDRSKETTKDLSLNKPIELKTFGYSHKGFHTSLHLEAQRETNQPNHYQRMQEHQGEEEKELLRAWFNAL